MKLGIAGIGRIAEDYIGLICGGQVAGVELTALCSRSGGRIARLKERFPVLDGAVWFADYDEMLASRQIDAVLICTPHGLHPAMTRKALAAGLHVLVEKPVGIFGDEVELALEASKRRPELVCGVMYNRRASSVYRAVKEYLEKRDPGALVRATWIITDLYRTDAYYRGEDWRGSWAGEGGGLLMTQASHQLDLMQWLCGMPRTVLARCSGVDRPIVTENEAELLFTYPNGAHGQFIASAHESPGCNILQLCYTKGSVTVRDDREVEIVELSQDEQSFARSCPSPFTQVPCSRRQLHFPEESNKVQQAASIQNFVDAAERGTPVQCPLEDGLHSLQIIHGAYLSQWKKEEAALPVDEKEFRKMLEEQEIR